jgi:integrase
MGLGSFAAFTVEEARERARKYLQMRADGLDPIYERQEERRKRKEAERLAAEAAKKDLTFRVWAEKYQAAQNWRPGSMDQAKRYFDIHIYPKIGDVPISAVNMDHIEEVIDPILDRKEHSAASRVLSYLNCVLDFAKAHGARTGDNPADLNGPLGVRMPRLVAARERATKGSKGNPYLDFKRIGEFMSALRRFHYHGPWWGKPPIVARALEFLVLTGVRTHMVTGHQGRHGADTAMKWNQIDWEERLATWTPEQHKVGGKTQTDFIVPLSKQAIAVLEEMRKLQEEWGVYGEDKPVFVHPPSVDKNPSRKPRRAIGKPIDHNTAWVFLRAASLDHGWKDRDGTRISPKEGWLAKDGRLITPHGFRRTFGAWSVWAGYEERDSEIALGHTVGGRVRNIYKQMADRVEPRRIMMEDWGGNYCGDPRPIGAADNVKPVGAAGNILRYRKAK